MGRSVFIDRNIIRRSLVAAVVFSMLISIFPAGVSRALSTGGSPADTPPDVITNAPADVADVTALLQGSAVPNGASTDVWFEWGTNPANLSNTTFVQNVGGGSSSIDFSASVAGLAENTAYHYRAVAQNSDGIVSGNIWSFVTAGSGGPANPAIGEEPDVTTISARSIEDDRAELRGEVRPNGLDTEVWFEWGENRFDLGDDTSRQFISGGTTFSSFDFTINNLDDNTLYYFRAVAQNDEGIDRGRLFNFRTDDNGNDDDDEPDIRDVDVENIDDDRARLVCTVDANGRDTDVWFEWDRDEDDVRDRDGEETRKVEVDRDETRREVKITITNLNNDTRYFFRCIARNSRGTDRSRIEDFRTDDNGRRDDEPDVTTRSATNIGQVSAVLRGEVDPNGEDTDVWFEWGTSRSNLNNISREEDIGDGTREEDFDRRITGLRPNTIYYFRAVAENREGIDRGLKLSFRTDRGATSVTPVTTTRTIPTPPITRIIEVFRDRFGSREEGLIITLDADTRRIGRGVIEYEISYDNRTDDTFTSTVLTLVIPDELEFVDASPRADDKSGDTIIFEIGTIRPGDDESFVIETEVAGGVDENDDIIFSASINYIDDDDKKIITVVDITRIADTGRNGFTAFFTGSLAEFFTNPFLWLIILLVVIFFVYRYFASLAKPKKESEFLDDVLQPPLQGENGF